MKVDQELIHSKTHSCLGGAVVKHWTPDRKVTGLTPGRAGSTPGQGAIKSTRSTQPSIPQPSIPPG